MWRGMCALVVLSGLACSKTEKRETGAASQPAEQAPATPRAASPEAPAAEVQKPAGASQPPKSLGTPKVPKDNPQTAAKVALGHKLFFDPRLSVDGSRSCYSCHQNEDGTGGHDPIAIGAKDVKLTRHAPVLWNVAYLPRHFWDGRADSLEKQALGAWSGGNMGVGEEGLAAKADEMYALPEYTKLFDAAFPGEGGTPQTVVAALSAYERTLFCGDTRFDRFAAGDSSALTEAEKAGWALFTGKGNCSSCHTPPFFSDAYMAEQGAYHNTGMGFEGRAAADVDPGRGKISNVPSDHGAFKTPSLRNVTKSAPYFHNGSVAKLEDAVAFMANGGFPNPNLDSKIVDRKLTPAEISSIVEFLGALDCDGKLEPPVSN